MITQCCKCKRVWVPTRRQWLAPNAAEMRQIEARDVTHGFCDSCTAKALAEVRRYRMRKQTKGARLRNFLALVMCRETLLALAVAAAFAYGAALAWGFGSRMDELILGF